MVFRFTGSNPFPIGGRRCIIYIVKRTQLYLDEAVWKALQIHARQSHCTISELVREAVREKFLDSTVKRKEALLSAIGIWKDRTDLPETSVYIRRLREDDRLKRFRK